MAVGSAVLNMTRFDAMLKDKYDTDSVKDMIYPNNPALALIPKFENSRGRRFVFPLRYSHTKGIANSFATAQANKDSSSQYEDFLVTRVKWYGLADIDNEVLLASQGDPHAFAEAVSSEIDSCLQGVTRKVAIDLYRAGHGTLGQVGTYSGGASTLTLKNIEDVAQFEVGMKLVASDGAAAEGGSLLAGGAAIALTAINRVTGVLTAGAAFDGTLTGLNADDYLYRHGDARNNGTAVALSGFEAWVPQTAPGATAFFGVDRSVDVTRLGGLRSDATGKTREEALIDAAMLAGREGARPDIVFMNWADVGVLIKELGTRVQRDDIRSPDRTNIGFKAIVLNYPGGELRIVADHNCPVKKAYLLQMSTMALHSMGPAVGLLTTDGMRVVRNHNDDSLEVRCGGYGQVVCAAPGWNVNLFNLGA